MICILHPSDQTQTSPLRLGVLAKENSLNLPKHLKIQTDKRVGLCHGAGARGKILDTTRATRRAPLVSMTTEPGRRRWMMTPSGPAYQLRQRKRSPSNQYNSAGAVSGMSRLRMAPLPYTEGPVPGLSRLELLRSEYRERALREKEDKMLRLRGPPQESMRGPPQESMRGPPQESMRGPPQESMRGPPQESMRGHNWTTAKRTAGVDRAHPLQPVHPPSAHIPLTKHPLPHVRSKSGPGRPDQWQELEKSEKDLEAEIRRKEALLREKLRRTEEELRRIQRERQEAERGNRETHHPKIRPRGAKTEEELRRIRKEREEEEQRARETQHPWTRPRGAKTEEELRRIRKEREEEEQRARETQHPCGGHVENSPLSIDQYRGGGVKPRKDSPLSIDQYSGGRVKARRDSPLSIDQYSGGGVKPRKDSPLYIDQYSGGGVKARRDSPLSIDRYSGGGVKPRKDSPLSIDQYNHQKDLASPQRPPLSHVEDSFHQLRLDVQGAQDSGRPPSETLDEVDDPPGPALVPCPLCGRCFMEHRLQKHSAVCEKMQSSRRKVFDSSKARAKGTDLEQYLHKNGRRPSPPPQVRVTSWRQKHESFLRTIRQARVVQDVVAKGGKISDLPPPPPEENPDYVACPHCSRRFAPRAAERHIPKCETIKSKPRPPPLRRR